MTPQQLQDYLHEQIPLSEAMEVRVLEAGPDLRLVAPLAPNVNHKKTVFGGSLYALAVLAGWSSVRLHMEADQLHGEIVIGRSDCSYLKPAKGDFVALCEPIEAMAWERFKSSLSRMGKGVLNLEVEVSCQEELVARFKGTYVVLAKA